MHLCKAGTGDGHIFAFARTSGYDGCHSAGARCMDRRKGLRDCPGLMGLDENAIGEAVADGGLNTSCIGHEQIIANHLNAIS